jgi:hypothetical protein
LNQERRRARDGCREFRLSRFPNGSLRRIPIRPFRKLSRLVRQIHRYFSLHRRGFHLHSGLFERHR